MKKKKERKEWKGLKMGNLFVGFVALLMTCSQTVHAEEINWQKAVEIAKRYVTLPQNDGKKAKGKGRKNKAGTPYYIYNDAHGQGFVIVSGDDQMGEVLGYSKEGCLDTLNANPCVKLLLSGYRQTFEVLKEGKVKVQSNNRSGLYSKTVAPMLKSKWGQSYPFNAKTGYDYSGCVATAVAQMMYYHQWPAQGQGKNEYVVTYYQAKKSADFSQSHYDWANMLPDYRYPVQSTPAQIDAVALLMSDVGVASFMQYTPSASGTQGVFAYQALQKHFDYSAAYVTKAVEGPGRFAEILRQELLNGCPVYLEGRPAGSASGHAWVTDGFDENGLFHMNFGWEGQGDAYYSLTNLNVSQTGSEFQGKPLAFNRAITAILAHPNNGKYPEIERGLLETSPQLMFNEGGSLSLKEASGKLFDPSLPVTVEMNSFVNRGKPFRGDIGVAVYDEAGNLKQVVYSDDHLQGGFTERLYGGEQEGWMGTDYLINQAQKISLSLAGLENGYYRIIAICAARKEDGSWDDFLPMKKAPVIGVELKDGAGRISEICSEDARFQLMGKPRLDGKAEQGSKVRAFFTIKNLNGVPRDCYLRVKLLDENQAVVLSTRVDQLTEIDGFSETEIPILLSVPAQLAPGYYQVKLEITSDEAETQDCPVNDIHNQDAAYIEVVKGEEKPLMAKAEVFLVDDSHEKIEGGSVDVSKVSIFKMGVSLRTSENLSYDGHVSLISEDVDTKEEIEVNGINDEVSISSSSEVPLYSYWLRKSNLPWTDGHTYLFRVMGEMGGKKVELKNPQEPSYYLKRKGDILILYQDIATGIENATTSDAETDISREGQHLLVSGKGVRKIKLYNVGGNLLRQASGADGKPVSISLQGIRKGVYLLRVETGMQSKTYKLLL